jgi:FixJ family two-component response regulator
MTSTESKSIKGTSEVLIVDDDSSILRALARLLRVSGFKTQIFDRPSALLASHIPTSNACMVLDLYLPEMSGIELYRRLKAAGRALPTVMITGTTDSRTRRMLNEIDPVAVLIKPFDESFLLEAISKALAPLQKSNP